MKHQVDVHKLSGDERRLILAMLKWKVFAELEHLGQDPRELDLPATWRRNDCHKVYALCEKLVARGIFHRQYGDEHQDRNYRGRIQDRNQLWYCFNETLFNRGNYLRSSFLSELATSLATAAEPRDVHTLIQAVLHTVGGFISSVSYRPSKRIRRELKRERSLAGDTQSTGESSLSPAVGN